MSTTTIDPRLALESLREAARQAQTVDEARRITSQINALTRRYKTSLGHGVPGDPVAHAVALEGARFASRPHLDYLSERLAVAVRDVERGQNRMLTVSMPPRSGKSTLTSFHFPTWILTRHPGWKIGMLSHDYSLVGGWARQVRSTIEEHPALGVTIAGRAGGASTEWDTTEDGGLLARSIGGSVTGKGFKVLLLDDIVKDFVAAHSEQVRSTVWSKWLSDFYTRLEPPYLVVAIGTRWHEDDFLGRLLSPAHEGNPDDWEEISFPAIAQDADVLGRSPGQPLYTPLIDETEEQAVARWADVKNTVGSYTWAALYQQAPDPAKGSIFDTGWWRYWTTNPANVTEDGRVMLVPTPDELRSARWLDSWDMAFKGGDDSDYVICQRWAKVGPLRFLMAQMRDRLTFTQTLATARRWSDREGLTAYASHVHERVVEDKANGTAVLDVLRKEIEGLVAVNPTDSKEGRARSITPECEAGNVVLPFPGDPGNEWVGDLLSELRNFPHGSNDDQVDGLTQALSRMRDSGQGSVTVPGRSASIQRNIGQTALAQGAARRYGATRR